MATPRDATPQEERELAELREKLEQRGVVKPVEKTPDGRHRRD